jgi:3-phosphoshikimate 1-carboxyvinyltransferase
VDALLKLGADISYLGEEGFPPTLLKPFSKQKENHLSIPGNVSSQYISALLMFAPTLEKGLTIELTGKVGSRPYIEMTLSLMEMYGVKYHWQDNVITIVHQEYEAVDYTIESDWSGASYWYSFVALAETAEIKLLGLRKNSLQGDIAIVDIMDKLGVKSTFDSAGVLLQKTESANEIDIDFSDCPDLAQTVAVICAANNIRCKMTGLESLRIKETDRITALQNELAKFNALLTEVNEGEWLVTADDFSSTNTPITFATYDDHRMAMAFAPLAMKFDIIIEEPSVVQKSYPRYWQNLEQVGLVME